jgi:GAF domain-containing protein
MSHDTTPLLCQENDDFPFICELSLQPLVAFWQQTVGADHPLEGALATSVQHAIRETPVLWAPIEDLAAIAQHRTLVDTLMTAVFPRASRDKLYAAALRPLYLQSFYATPPFTRLLLADNGSVCARVNVSDATLAQVRILYAYALILQRFYGISLDFEYPLIFTATDPDTGLDCHFKAHWDARFVEIRPVGQLPALTRMDKDTLLAHLDDPQVLMEFLPPERFVFQGFLVLNALEVTDQEVLSGLKRDLIDRESIISTTRFHGLRDKLRTLFRRPDLGFRIAALQGEQIFMLDPGTELAHHCIFADSQHYTCADLAGSVYERVLTRGEPLLIEDLLTFPERSGVEETLLQQGIRNFVVAPLYYQDTLIGLLELRSPHPGDLHALNAMKLQEVLPLFAMAIRRSMDELNIRIQAVIKEQCTAIHPVVEWRFRQAAMRWAEQRQQGTAGEMEPIVFNHVYPLYGVSDIRSSSTHRITAIQADLVAHLRLARHILQLGWRCEPLPILVELAYHVDHHIALLEKGLGAGDEAAMLDFLRREVEPVLHHIQTFSNDVRENVAAYRAAMDPRLGTLYRQRKDFEESVTQLNETLAAYLNRQEEKAQAMYPHYFEQHKTDGVEYSIYIGASLVEQRSFDMLYVHNLRLWQLQITCGLARVAAQAKARLKMPLDMAHLILVQNTPLAVRFRFDEKRFDIDGAYNMRYEIVKKRIDKAMIKGTQDRLTQPGKIAIVYSQPAEAREYHSYIAYLQTRGHLTGAIEDVGLEDVPGAQGLRALRVTVEMPQSVAAGETAADAGHASSPDLGFNAFYERLHRL